MGEVIKEGPFVFEYKDPKNKYADISVVYITGRDPLKLENHTVEIPLEYFMRLTREDRPAKGENLDSLVM